MSDLLNFLDPDYSKEKLQNEFIIKLKNIINLSDNTDLTSLYKYKLDDIPVFITFIEYAHNWKRFVPISSKLIIEIANKDIKPIFLFAFTDGLYIWDYDKSKLIMEYRYNDKERHSKYVYILNEALNIFDVDIK